VLWWAASVAAASATTAVAAADAVLARTLMLVLQPLDPWEAPRPRAPPLRWSSLQQPLCYAPEIEFCPSFLAPLTRPLRPPPTNAPTLPSLSLSLSFVSAFSLSTTGRVFYAYFSDLGKL
jgi:hypothetical protein